jgi:iron complex transport system substrate-binding protein
MRIVSLTCSNTEIVAALAPDAVVIAWCGVEPEKYRTDVIYRNPAFRDLPAVRHRRVFRIPEAFLGRPGPRLVEGIRALRDVVAAVREGRPAPE